MAKRYYIEIGYGPRQRRLRLPGVLARLAVLAGGTAVIILLLPVIGFILLTIMAVMAVGALATWIWWMVKGRKQVQQMREDLEQRFRGGHGEAFPPRKKIHVKVRSEEGS